MVALHLKSKLFRELEALEIEGLRNPDGLPNDCAAVASLPREVLASVCKFVPRLVQGNKKTFSDTFREVHTLLGQSSVPTTRFLIWYFERVVHSGADISDISNQVDDMVDLAIIDPNQGLDQDAWKETLKVVLESQDLKTLKSIYARKRAEEGVLPRFVDASFTAEQRAVLDQEHLEDFERSPTYISVCTFRINLDGEQDNICFQMTTTDLKELIDILQRAERVLKAFEIPSKASQ